MSKISLILPVYNGSQRIIQCLNSIVGQSYTDFDLLIIDDGSKDNSACLIEEYLDGLNDNIKHKITFIKQENKGVSKTRNLGIQMVNGEWIGFIDQDDYIEKEYLEKYIATLQLNEKKGCFAELLVGGYDRVSDEGKVIRHEVLKGKKWDKYIVLAPWAHLYRRQFLIENNILFLETKIGEDVFFNLKAYAYANKVVIEKNNSEYKWVFNNDSVSNSKQNKVTKQNNPIILLNAIVDMYKNDKKVKTPYEEQEYYIIRYIVWYCLFTIRNSHRKEHKIREKELFDFLKTYYPNYYKNKYLWKKIEGEPIKIYLAVIVYLLLYHIHIV